MSKSSPTIFASLLALVAAVGLAGCETTGTAGGAAGSFVAEAKPTTPTIPPAAKHVPVALDAPIAVKYAAVEGEPWPIPAVPLKKIRKGFERTEIAYSTTEAPGTVIVDPVHRYLYLVEAGGRAIRYGVGVGKAGFGWVGEAEIRYKQEWPKWFPPMEMIARRKDLRAFADGKGAPGGPGNPLGVRAMYLYLGKRDTLFRIHGTTEPESIGTQASSGCIRMINQDAIDLYDRVPLGTKVVVLASPGAKAPVLPPLPGEAKGKAKKRPAVASRVKAARG